MYITGRKEPLWLVVFNFVQRQAIHCFFQLLLHRSPNRASRTTRPSQHRRLDHPRTIFIVLVFRWRLPEAGDLAIITVR
jgi:hypothetical protein